MQKVTLPPPPLSSLWRVFVFIEAKINCEVQSIYNFTAMGNHYIPRYYLKGFTESDDVDSVWVYKKNGNTYKASIRKIAQENRLYSKDMEQYLANKVEEPANKVIKKIRELQMLSAEERLIFSQYMIVLWKRVPKQKEQVKGRAPEIMNPVFERIEQQLTELGEKYPAKIELVEKRKRELHEIRNNKEDELIYYVWLNNLPPDKTSQSVDVLSQMTWRFLIADKDQYFITSDNPHFFFHWMGIGNEKSEVTFPVTKKIALWATWRADIKEGFFLTTSQAVKEINRRTASICSQYLYSPYAEEWIRTLANKDIFRLTRLI